METNVPSLREQKASFLPPWVTRVRAWLQTVNGKMRRYKLSYLHGPQPIGGAAVPPVGWNWLWWIGVHKACPTYRGCCAVNLTLAHLAVFAALQNGFASISLFHRYVVRTNRFMPGSSNTRAVGDAGGERWGILFPKTDNLLSTEAFYVLYFLEFGKF